MRIVSLLPAATEIVAALGGAGALVGVSHECDYPPWTRSLPRVTATPLDPSASSRTIDAEVRRLQMEGRPAIAVDGPALARLRPDVIITQSLCEVCAVFDGEVHRMAAALAPTPRVLSLGARDLAGIHADIMAVGAELDLADEARELVAGMAYRLDRLQRRTAGTPRPRVAAVEWLDPPYLAGHWVPELIESAGGDDVGARPGTHSTRRAWSEIAELRPDVVIVMLCGFDVERARREIASLDDPVALELIGTTPTWTLDGNAYTSRPGPRVVDGAERIASALEGREAPGLVWAGGGRVGA